MDAKSKKKFLFDAHKIDSVRFLLPDDGRKAKHKAAQRRALWLELASFGNCFGRDVFPSNKTLAKKLLWSEPTVERRMRELKDMGFVVNEGRSHRFGGTMVRHLAVPSDSPALPSDTHALPSDSAPLPSANDGSLPSPNDGQSAQGTARKASAHEASVHDSPENGDFEILETETAFCQSMQPNGVRSALWGH